MKKHISYLAFLRETGKRRGKVWLCRFFERSVSGELPKVKFGSTIQKIMIRWLISQYLSLFLWPTKRNDYILMPKIYTSAPEEYPVCGFADCPMAETCLRQLAYRSLTVSETYLRLINPRKCSKDASCQFFRDAQPVRFAIGFTNFQKQMYPDQYKAFCNLLIGVWNRNNYFAYRRGSRILSPREQAIVLGALKKVGVSKKMEFDRYQDLLNWYE